MKQNQDYKNAALDALRGNWAPALLCTIVLMLITYLVLTPSVVGNMLMLGQSVLDLANPMYFSGAGLMLSVFLFFPLSIGVCNTFRKLFVFGNTDCVKNLLTQSFNGYLRNVLGMLLVYVFVFLWSLLLIIPGIVKVFSYAMTPYILKDYPEISVNKAIDMSRAMMTGRKFDLFYLHLSFIGWWILSILTFGIGFIWLIPYVLTSQAAFYDDVKQDYLNRI